MCGMSSIVMPVPDNDLRTFVREHLPHKLSTTARIAILSLGVIGFCTTTALAQTEQAGTVCGSTGYNLFIGLLYVGMAASVSLIFASAFGGAAAKSVGFLSRTVSQSGNQAIVASMSSIIILLVLLSVIGIGVTNMEVSIPSECITFW